MVEDCVALQWGGGRRCCEFGAGGSDVEAKGVGVYWLLLVVGDDGEPLRFVACWIVGRKAEHRQETGGGDGLVSKARRK